MPVKFSRLVFQRLVLTLPFICSGCVNIETHMFDGQIERDWYFGSLSLDFQSSDAMQVVETQGLGVIRTPLGYHIGYYNTSTVAIPSACRVLVWVEEDQNIAIARDVLQNVAGACLLAPR